MEQNLPTQVIPLAQIHPDPAQPRRLLPSDLAEALAAGASPSDILTQLRSRAERDKWTRERLGELDALANSIAADGLLQPIRVIRDSDESYRIEEGERRWWAHHLLVQQGKPEFQDIAVFVLERESQGSGLLRRRVAENVLRSGFTAIELARAMASRIQEILGAEPDIKKSEAEQRVGSENGMSDRRVRQFVALLTLSPEAQELAQQARLSENALRQIVSIKDATRQLAAIRDLMHPVQKPRKTTRAKDRGVSTKARHTNGRDHNRFNSKTTRSKKNAERRGDEQRRKQPLEKLLAFVRSLGAKDWEQLDSTDWAGIHVNKTDWRILLHLYHVLACGLEITKGDSEDEKANP